MCGGTSSASRGRGIRESTKSNSRTVARAAEHARRRELEQGFNRIERQRAAQLFSVAAEDWLSAKRAHLAPRSVVIERANLKHLNLFFGKMLLCDIRAEDIGRYQAVRLQEGAAPKTVNLEIGTVRAVMRRNRLSFAIQPDVRMLRASDDVGRALSREEDSALLAACQSSRSRSLYTAVELALNTCMRYSELRLLKWGQVDFAAPALTVGASKTEAGAGRPLPLNARAFAVLSFWASLFPGRERSLCIPRRAIRGRWRWVQSGAHLSQRPDKADWPLERGVGSREDSSGRPVSLSRSAPHGMHANA
jgi:integrase